MRRRFLALGSVFIISGLGYVTTAAAQQPAGVEQHTEHVAEAPAEPPPSPFSWDIAAGGVLTTGNTQNLTFTAGSHFRFTELPHNLELEVAYVLGLSGANYGTTNAHNLNARGRYDYYFDEMNAVFLAARFRQDEFAGLAPRIQGQVGYMRNFLRENDGKHRLWGEIGYDLTGDVFTYERVVGPGTACDPAMGRPCDQLVHSARLYLGYTNEVNENLTFRTGLEVLVNLNPDVVATTPAGDEITGLEDVRVNWDAALNIKIVGNLQAELRFLMLFDNVPVGIATDAPANKLDTTTTLNLVYTLL